MKVVPIIVGPTAVGKTGLALALAEYLAVEIVSADSRQIYRFMDIGTAKPTPAERQQVVHHFIDVKNPDEDYSAGTYGKDARKKIAQIRACRKVPLVVGGAGFYIRALVDGLSSPPSSTPETKQLFRQRLQKEGLAVLRNELEKIDPVAAENIHPNDTQRTLRALEVYHLTGETFSSFKNKKSDPAPFDPYFIGLSRERKQLYQIIDRRVDTMLAQGLIDEVKMLFAKGYTAELNALRTVGYCEVCQFMAGELNYDKMVREIKKNTRRYAKRQLTWFRADDRIRWIELDASVRVSDLAKSIGEEIKSSIER
jgi:tRNA dimethylallyltransferase